MSKGEDTNIPIDANEHCDVCSVEFTTKQARKAHYLEHHAQVCVVTQHNNQKISLARVDGVFKCNECGKDYDTKSGIRSHLARQYCQPEGPTTGPQRQAVIIPPTATAALVLPTSSAEPLGARRGHDEAVLFACQRQNAPEMDKIATLGVVHFLGLEPFTVEDSMGMEQNALAHPDGVKRLCVGPLKSPVTVPNPNKRKLMADNVCQKCSPVTIPSLDSVFAFSSYSSVMRTRTFVELSESICYLLNEDWNFEPQYRYGCAQILAGCLLINTTNGHAVLANTVEVYGRTVMVDAHCESFGLKKGVAIQTSLPKPGVAYYKDVWPSTMFAVTEGERLVIGTQSFDALVTSSIRLDVRDQGSVGAATGNFRLTNEAESTATRIFLDKESLDMGVALCQDRKAYRISNSNLHCQLRQLKTKFYDASTFFLCRASGPLTKAHSFQPCTIFTFCNHSHSGDGHHASKLFFKICTDVLKTGNDAVLEVETVRKCRQNCSNDTKSVPPVIDSILSLFKNDASTIPILGNRQLNGHLETLANILSSYISGANKAVLTATIQSLED